MSCGIALNIGRSVGRCVSTQKETILKAIVVDFLNLLNRKSYRQSLGFFAPRIRKTWHLAYSGKRKKLRRVSGAKNSKEEIVSKTTVKM
jgi:hypothetical protein